MQPASQPEDLSHQGNPAEPSADTARRDASGQRGTGPAEPDIRVGDRDRDVVAHRLQEAFAEGRLDDEDFDQRMRAALTARVGGDLAVLTQDLPESSGPTTRPARRQWQAAGRAGSRSPTRARSAGAAAGACRSGSPPWSIKAPGTSIFASPS